MPLLHPLSSFESHVPAVLDQHTLYPLPQSHQQNHHHQHQHHHHPPAFYRHQQQALLQASASPSAPFIGFSGTLRMEQQQQEQQQRHEQQPAAPASITLLLMGEGEKDNVHSKRMMVTIPSIGPEDEGSADAEQVNNNNNDNNNNDDIKTSSAHSHRTSSASSFSSSSSPYPSTTTSPPRWPSSSPSIDSARLVIPRRSPSSSSNSSSGSSSSVITIASSFIPTSTTTPTPSFFTPTYVQPPPPFIQPPSRPTTTTPTLPHPPAWTDIFFAHTRSHSSSSSLSKPPESPTPPPMRRWPSLASFRSSSTTSTTSFQRLGMMSRSGSTRPFTPSTHDIQEEGILNDPPQRRRAFSRLSILNRSFTPPPQAQPEVSSKRWSIFSKPIRPHLDEPSPLQRTSIQINPEDQEPPLTSPKKRFSWKVSTDSIFPLRRRQSTATISSTHDTPTPTTTDATQPSLFRTASTRLSIMMSRTSIISTTTITEQPRQKLGPLRLLSRRLKNHPDPPPPSPSTPRPSMAYTDVESDTYTMEEALQLAAGVSRRSLSITTIPASRRSSLSVSTTSQPILEALKIAFSSDRPQFFGEQVPPRIAATPRTSMSQTSPVDTPLQRVGSVSTVHRKSVIVNHGNTGHWFVTPAPSIAWGEESYKTALDVARQATTISEKSLPDIPPSIFSFETVEIPRMSASLPRPRSAPEGCEMARRGSAPPATGRGLDHRRRNARPPPIVIPLL